MAYKVRKVVESFEGRNPDYLNGKTIFPLLKLECNHTIIDTRALNYMNEKANQISAMAETMGKPRKARCWKCADPRFQLNGVA